MSVTIQQIAQQLDISYSTVARVLKGNHKIAVAEQTRCRVLTAASELGYRPSLIVRGPRDTRANRIDIFAPLQAVGGSGESRQVYQGISEVLDRRQLRTFVTLESGEEARGLPAWNREGAILIQQPLVGMAQWLPYIDYPLVLVNALVPESVCVLVDEADGVRQAMEHLWKLGHRRIAYVPGAEPNVYHYSHGERYQAYITYLSERRGAPIVGHDLGAEYSQWVVDMHIQWLRHVVLTEHVTAVLAYDHLVAMEMLAAAQRLLLRVPHDLSIISCGDDILFTRMHPPLTVVAQPAYALGQTAAELLLQRIDAGEGGARPEDSPIPAITRMAETLIVRESTAPPYKQYCR